MHSADSTCAHAVQLLNEKIAELMPFKNKTVSARVHAVVYVTAEIFKKGKKKTNYMPLPKFRLQFAFSWSVYISNRSESYLIVGRSNCDSMSVSFSLNKIYIYFLVSALDRQ